MGEPYADQISGWRCRPQLRRVYSSYSQPVGVEVDRPTARPSLTPRWPWGCDRGCPPVGCREPLHRRRMTVPTLVLKEDRGVPEWAEAIATVVKSAAFFLLVLTIFVVVTHVIGYEIEFDPDKKLPRVFARRKREIAQASVAFERLAEVGKGLRGVVEATEAEVDGALDTWFRSLCMSVAWTLATDNDEIYRVAIWTKDSTDPDILRALAWHMMPDHKTSWKTLDRNTSLAGLAMRTKQTYYSKDVLNDPEYKRRDPSDPDPSYRSIFAVPLGDDEPWGAMTIDARAKDGFTEQDRQIAVQFGGLSTIGAGVGIMRRRLRDPGPSSEAPATNEGV